MNAEQSAQIEMLYLQMFDGMMAYARSSLPEEALAEEAVQETFRIACQKAEALCNSPNPKGWLIKTLKFTIQNIKRSRESMRLLLAEYLAAQAQQAAFSEDKIRLEVLYGNIADQKEFQLLKEMAVEGKSHLEMAEIRGISISACKKRVQRAKKVLQKKLKKDNKMSNDVKIELKDTLNLPQTSLAMRASPKRFVSSEA